MALNEEARDEAAAFVRAGRISMAALLRTSLNVSSCTPQVGAQLEITWAVRGVRNAADVDIQLLIDDVVLREGALEGRIALRVPDRHFELMLVVGGRVRRRETVRPLLRVPELFGLTAPDDLYHDDPFEISWASSSEIQTIEVRVDPGRDHADARNWVIDPGALRVALGPLMPGEHHVQLHIASADAALSPRASRVIDIPLLVRERPPRGTLGFERAVIQLGGSVDLSWHITGARELLLITPDGVSRPVAPVGLEAMRPERCGDFDWALLATAAHGTQTRLEVRLQVVAPPVTFHLEHAPGPADGPLRLRFEATGAVSLQLELPQREGASLPLPLVGYIESDRAFNESLIFVLEAADGRIERRTFEIAPVLAVLSPLPARLIPLPVTLLTLQGVRHASCSPRPSC